jgi:hypothetical protein
MKPGIWAMPSVIGSPVSRGGETAERGESRD